MVGISKKLEEKRAKLARLIERKAFDAYVRHGVVPDDMQRLAETAADGQKFLDLCAGLSIKALPDGRPTTHYTWRTTGDDRVRHTHSALEGQVFAWTDAPSEGHPGTAPNCRCWAEPYYGNPAIPDAFLQLQSERRVSSNAAELWASIDTLSRPDGSVAASHIRMTDGTSVQSTFSGPNTSQMVSLPDGGFYQLNSTGDARQIAVGQNGQTAVKVAWLRQSLVPRLLPPPPAEAIILPDYDPNLQLDVLVTPAALVLRGAAVLYNLAVAAPKPLGLSEDYLPVLAFRVWSGKNRGDTSTFALEALTAEQVAQTCKSLPDVQTWTTQAAAILLPQRPTMSASAWGTAVHFSVHGQVEAHKEMFPEKYANVFSELTILDGRDGRDDDGPYYGQSGSSRLDVVEKVSSNLFCVIDVKTGRSGLTTSRIREILSKLPEDVQIFILEVRPFL
jgi:hypothetical protein